MSVNRGLFVRNLGATGTSPTEARLAFAGLLAENAPGVPRPGALFQASTRIVSGLNRMAYSVAPAHIVVTRDAGEGAYLLSITGTTEVAAVPAPATGSRIDLVYVRQNDPDKGDADNAAVVKVLAGKVATEPVAPYSELPSGAYVLAEASVLAGANATAGVGVSIVEKWQYTALRGAPIPLRNQAESDALVKYPGLTVRRLDLTGAPTMSWSGKAWHGAETKPFGHAGMVNAFQKAPFNPDNSPTFINVSPQLLRGGVQFVNGRLVVPETGLYRVAGKYYASGDVGTYASGDVWINGTTTAGANQAFWKSDANDYHGFATVVRPLQAGDTLELRGTNRNGSFWGTNGYNGAWMEVEWYGPSESWS